MTGLNAVSFNTLFTASCIVFPDNSYFSLYISVLYATDRS